MDHFTPLPALAGGLLIGLAAALLFAANGRIPGISGVLGGLITPGHASRAWRALFLGGLFAGGAIVLAVHPSAYGGHAAPSLPALIAAGVLVGAGTRMSAGCTSGHGLCGMARFSKRSIVATVTFMAAGAATVYVARHLAAGVL